MKPSHTEASITLLLMGHVILAEEKLSDKKYKIHKEYIYVWATFLKN